MSDPVADVRELVIRVEGKLDAYAAGQSARLDAIDKRLDAADVAIGDLRVGASSHVTRDELAERLTSSPPGRGSVNPWIIAGIILAGLALAAPALSSLITLIDKIAN